MMLSHFNGSYLFQHLLSLLLITCFSSKTNVQASEKNAYHAPG